MATFAPVRSAFNPPVPQDFKELGISESLVLDLMLRRMLIEGYSSIAGLGRSLSSRTRWSTSCSNTCARCNWSRSRA